jgi:transposase
MDETRSQFLKTLSTLSEEGKEEKSREDYFYSDSEVMFNKDCKLRLIGIRSSKGSEREMKTALKANEKQAQSERKQLKKLKRKSFSCDEDCEQAIQDFKNSLKALDGKGLEMEFTAKWLIPGRPKAGEEPGDYRIHIIGELAESEEKKQVYLHSAGWFCLATNSKQDAREILQIYKSQSKVERGFRFLKSPDFLSPAIFLNKPSRIDGLLFVMTVSLLVYCALEKRIREVLKEIEEDFFPDQRRKPTRNPTAAWVFSVFKPVQIIIIEGIRKTANLKRHHKKLLSLLGEPFKLKYMTPT